MRVENYSWQTVRKEDLVIIQDLAKVVWPHTFGEILTADQIEYMLNWMYSIESLESKFEEGHFFRLLYDDEQPIGFAHLEKEHPQADCYRVHKLYLLPNQQGKGLGKLMLDFIEKEALKYGLSKVHLNVNRFNRSVQFYLKMGFEVIEEVNNDIGEGYLMEDYVMLKAISR